MLNCLQFHVFFLAFFLRSLFCNFFVLQQQQGKGFVDGSGVGKSFNDRGALNNLPACLPALPSLPACLPAFRSFFVPFAAGSHYVAWRRCTNASGYMPRPLTSCTSS